MTPNADTLRLLEAEIAALKLAIGAICFKIPDAADAVRAIAALADEISLPSALDEDQRTLLLQRLGEMCQSPPKGAGQD